MSAKTMFNIHWQNENLFPQYSKWIKEVKNDPYKAFCTVCSKPFSLSNMGKQAVTSHERSVRHKRNIEAATNSQVISRSFFPKNVLASENREQGDVGTPLPSSSQQNVDQVGSCLQKFVIKESALRAEIIWAMKLVESHSSLNSMKDAAELFQYMLPDSEIGKQLTMGNNKMSYLICFGLAPYFSQSLIKELSDTQFVVCFDEALNRISQRGQMDLIIRFWSKAQNEVTSRYLTSVFLGHATANDLLRGFYEGTAGLNLARMMQISMDGPNVNLKFLKCIKADLHEERGCELLDLGTCALHVVHGAFQTGHKIANWNLNAVFGALYRMFKDSPARRADFTAVTGSQVFPLKFCSVRWVENVAVAERAIAVFPSVKKYIGSTNTLPKNMTCDVVEQACTDKLFLAKVAFFMSVACILEPFLKKFQTANPMVPFLYDSISFMVRQLMTRFIKKEIMTEASSSEKLFKIDMNLSDNHRKHRDIDLGIAAARYVTQSSASELQKMEFRVSCKKFLIGTTCKIIERSSIDFFMRSTSSLNPKLLRSNLTVCEKRMDVLLQTLHEKNQVTAVSADRAKQQFSDFCERSKMEWKDIFNGFSESNMRLDSFYWSLIGKDCEMKDLWEVIKIVMTLSHGNASVESGFSINKDILVQNLVERSLIAYRTVYDSVKASGGVFKVPVTKALMQSAKMARSRYHQALEDEKVKKQETLKADNEKRKAANEIKLLRQKKAKLSEDVTLQTITIDKQIQELSKCL